MTDEAGGDDKILMVPSHDPRVAHIKDLEPGKSVEGAHWGDRVEAEKVILEAIDRATKAGMTTARWTGPGH
jgi:inorganic pyrophosphatase